MNRRVKLVWRLYTLGCLLLAELLGAGPVAAASNALSLQTWGFYVTYDPASRESLYAHISQLDVVVPGYFGIDSAATIHGTDDPSIDRIVIGAGKRLLPMVENRARYADLSPQLNDATRRAQAVAAITALATQHGYAGITLDFEAVSPSDRAGLTTFIQDLAAALHAEGKLLEVAVPAKSGHMTTGWAGAYDDAAIGKAADYVIVMAYGYRTANSTRPGPISPLGWFSETMTYAASVIPENRLIAGIGVWGYDWNQTNPARAVTRRYSDTIQLIDRFSGTLSYDSTDAAAKYLYQDGGATHQVWFEDASSIQQKISSAIQDHASGVAFWRLGQEPPGLWNNLEAVRQPDFAVSQGWFYGEAANSPGLGYNVSNDGGVQFWSEFQRLGGVSTLGYPTSRRFVGSDGFTYQVFQRGVLQWRPEIGKAYLANTFDLLSATGQDKSLEALGIPAPIQNDGSNGDWNRARQIRLSWLTNPAIKTRFYANPNSSKIPSWSVDQSISLYGLPTSQPVRSGPFIIQRFQRISLQLWVDSVPGMPPKGSVVGVLGGDLLRQSGWVPVAALAPEAPH